jgi:hypothetical protein
MISSELIGDKVTVNVKNNYRSERYYVKEGYIFMVQRSYYGTNGQLIPLRKGSDWLWFVSDNSVYLQQGSGEDFIRVFLVN